MAALLWPTSMGMEGRKLLRTGYFLNNAKSPLLRRKKKDSGEDTEGKIRVVRE